MIVLVTLLIATSNGASSQIGGDAKDGGLHQVSAEDVIPVPMLTPEEVAALPETTTDTNLPHAPVDPGTDATDGEVVSNSAVIPVFTAPGGAPLAKLPVTQVGSKTWLPVVAKQPGWLRVLLPSRPNQASGWIDESRVEIRSTPYLIRVHLNTRTIELSTGEQPVRTWMVGIGKTETPTPPGRTFLLAKMHDPQQTFSPVILPLGTHSTALSTFSGGPGTVGFHTWPNDSVIGTPSSAGCIRVTSEAMEALKQVPLGTLVLIDER